MDNNYENNMWKYSVSNDILLKDSKLTVENLKRAKAMLRVKKCCGRKEGDLILIYNEKFTIGRSQIASLSVRVPEISRKHCTIRKRSFSGWEILAEGAAGTYVNGQKLKVLETRELSCFDEIILAGIISFIFNDYVAIPKPSKYTVASMDTYSGNRLSRATSSRTYSDRGMLPDDDWLGRDKPESTAHVSWNVETIRSLNSPSTTFDEGRSLTQSTVVLSDEEIETRAQTSHYNNDSFINPSAKKVISYGRDIALEPVEEFRHAICDDYAGNMNTTAGLHDNNDSIIQNENNLDADNYFIRPVEIIDKPEISTSRSPVIRKFVEDTSPITNYSSIQGEMTPLFSPSWDSTCHRPRGSMHSFPMLNPIGKSTWSPNSSYKKRPFPFHESALSSPEDAIGKPQFKKLPFPRCTGFSEINNSPEDGSTSSGILDFSADRRRKLFTSMMSRPRESYRPFSSNSCKTKEKRDNTSSPFGIMEDEKSELLEMNRNLQLELEASMEKCRSLINEKKTSEEIANEKLSESTKMVEELVGIKSKYIELCGKYEAVSTELKNTAGQLDKFQSMYSSEGVEKFPDGIKPENVSYIKSIRGSFTNIETLNRMVEEHRTNSEKSHGLVSEDHSKAKIETQNEMIDKFSDLIETELQCAICNEILVKPVMLTCSHVFCRYCIDQWKKKESHCPICRKNDITVISALMCENFIDKFIELFKPDLKENREKIILEREEASKETVVDPAPRRENTIPLRLRHNMILSLEAFRNGLGIFANNGALQGVDNAAIIEDLTVDEALPSIAVYDDVPIPRERRRTRIPHVYAERYQREPRRTRRLVGPQEWM